MNGTLYDRDSLPAELVILFGTSLGLSPVCYLRERLLLRHHLDVLGRAAETLGYSGFDAQAGGDALASIDAPDVIVSLVPTPFDHKTAAPGDRWMLVVEAFTVPDASAPLCLGVSHHRRNHLSPTINTLLLGDGELLAGTREAAASGLDDVVWLHIEDAVSCIGAGALFAETEGGLITPPLSEGVPDTAWRSACIEELDLIERRLELDQLRSAESVACLWPWGSTQAVGVIDGTPFADASLAHRLATAVAAAGSRG